MRVVAISVGRPRPVQWRGRSVQTSIFKTPVSHRVKVASSNIEGDQQSDLSVHGGPEKAVYAYPAEHYDYWRRELPDAELAWGAFGENFTTEGMTFGSVTATAWVLRSSLSPNRACLVTSWQSVSGKLKWSSVSSGAAAADSIWALCEKAT